MRRRTWALGLFLAAWGAVAPVAARAEGQPARAAQRSAASQSSASAPASQPATGRAQPTPNYRQLQQQLVRLFNQKKYEEAVEVSRQIIRLAPPQEQPDSYYNLACALARLSKSEEALAALKKATEVGFAQPEHMQADEDLASLRSDNRFAAMVKLAEENAAKGAGFPLDAGHEIAGVKMVEGVVEGGLRYRLRMDPNATKDRPNRLIVWLHPSGGYGNNMVEAMSPMFLRHGFALLVFTQKNTMGWSEPDMARALKTAAEVGKAGGIDANRPILMGYSAGGQAALMVWFAKSAAVGGLILDAAYPLDPEAYAQGRTVPAGPPKDAAAKETPLFVAVGDQDGGMKFWQKVQGDWLGAGVPLVVHYVPGAKHQWLFNQAMTVELEKWLTDVAAGKLPTTPASQPTTRTGG